MIRHIVTWKLVDQTAEERLAAVAEMAGALESLVGVVPGLRSLTVRPNVAFHEANWHAVLVSDHDSVADLEAYQVHPAHVTAAAVPRKYASERAAVDIEL